VQCSKLLVQEAGLGAEWVREPRLPISGGERDNGECLRFGHFWTAGFNRGSKLSPWREICFPQTWR